MVQDLSKIHFEIVDSMNSIIIDIKTLDVKKELIVILLVVVLEHCFIISLDVHGKGEVAPPIAIYQMLHGVDN